MIGPICGSRPMRFPTAYADQTEADHAALVAAVQNGRLPALILEN